MIRALGIASVLSFAVFSLGAAWAQDQAPASAAPAAEKKPGPADGFTLHVTAPHKFEDGTVHGPYHHYCKAISPEVLQCLLFESTDPNARLTDVEYFVSKSVSRTQVPVKTWNKYYHDHEVEIATGRVQILDLPEAQAKEVAAVPLRQTGSFSTSGRMEPRRPPAWSATRSLSDTSIERSQPRVSVDEGGEAVATRSPRCVFISPRKDCSP